MTLKQADLPERIPYARTPRKLPVVLGADEVVCFLEAVPSLKARVALTTAYAAGLRASEAAGLKVADIDSSRMVVRVEQGKGGRDRYVMLSPQLLGSDLLQLLSVPNAHQAWIDATVGRADEVRRPDPGSARAKIAGLPESRDFR